MSELLTESPRRQTTFDLILQRVLAVMPNPLVEPGDAHRQMPAPKRRERVAPSERPRRHLRPVSPTVLVTDGLQRKALSATRALGTSGFRVMVSDRSIINPARFSRFSSRALRSPAPEDGLRYSAWLQDAVRCSGVSVVLAIDDATTASLVYRDISGAVSLVPTPQQFEVCRDKLRTVALAEQAGVPVPRAIGISSLDEARSAAQAIGLPAVIKARESSGGRGIAFLNDMDDLDAVWPHFEGQGAYIQQRVPIGRKFDVCLLYDRRGTLRRQFVQEELRWYPTETSVSTVQRSVHRPDLLDLARRTLEPIGWCGIVELEYMEDEDGTPWLLEINPRLWSSVELAVQCGIDFPTLAVKLALGQRIPPDPGYAENVYCSWALPGELLRRVRCFFRGDRIGQRRACPAGSHDNILSLSDPIPVLGVFLTVARHIFDVSLWRHLFCRP